MITFHQDCSIFETKKDGYGKTQKVNEVQTKCRAKEKFQLVINQNAEKVTSQIEFTIPVDVHVKTGFQIEYEGNTYKILSIKLTRNTIGHVVKKVLFV